MSEIQPSVALPRRSLIGARVREAALRSLLPLSVLVVLAATPWVGAFGLPVLALALWCGLKRVC